MAPAGNTRWTALAFGIALGATGCEPDEAGDGGIDLLDAIVIAEAEVPDALTLDAERTVNDVVPEYDIDRYQDGEVHEVLIDGDGNAHVVIDPDDPDEAAAEAALLSAHELSVTEAIEIAIAAVEDTAPDGIAVVAELDVERETMQVGIEDGDDFTLVVIALATEEVIEIGDAPVDD